ncbi:MAG: segregation/condensation protein A [Gemmatimonadetes bacterium]|nr:segregation/condensation protein A [Gemmatimonadota bacterium]
MTAPPETAAEPPFVVHLEEFSGPLDLLLHLIREQEIDIADIPIAQIAEQFLAAIGALGLNQAAEYLEMAAQLLRIKIQMLLPRPAGDDEWEDPRAELVRRLLEYEQVREVARWLARQAEWRSEHFGRGFLPEPPDAPPSPVTFDLMELMRAVDEVLAGMPRPEIHRVVPRPLDVEGATRRLRELLRERPRIEFREALGDEPTIADVISLLIAVLEMSRLGEVRLAQSRPFGTVDIVRESVDQAA